MDVADCNNRIIFEAAKLFSSFGIRSVTMDMLAVNLGMSKRTIYENFKDKDEILVAVMKCMSIKRREMIEKVISETPDSLTAIFFLVEKVGDHLRAVNPLFFEDMKKFHHEVLKKIDPENMINSYSDGRILIDNGIAEGLFRPEINSDIVSRCLDSVFRITADEDLFESGKYSREEMLNNTFYTYLRGICTPSGEGRINELLSR